MGATPSRRCPLGLPSALLHPCHPPSAGSSRAHAAPKSAADIGEVSKGSRPGAAPVPDPMEPRGNRAILGGRRAPRGCLAD